MLKSALWIKTKQKEQKIITPGRPTTPNQLDSTARRTLRYTAMSPASPGVPWSSWMGVKTPIVRADAAKCPLPTKSHGVNWQRGTFHLP